MIGLKMAMLLVLGLLQCSYESQEENVKDRPYLEKAQNIFLAVYIAFTTVVFIAYLLKTTGSHLVTVRPRGRRDNAENPCCCDCYKPGTDSSKAIRGTFCLCCTCCSIIRRIVCCFCDNVKCGPCTCCRRPAHVACGLSIRIVVRELLAAAGTLAIILNEEPITNADGIKDLHSANRTALLMFFTALAHLVGLLVGALVGRWLEGCWNGVHDAVVSSRRDAEEPTVKYQVLNEQVPVSVHKDHVQVQQVPVQAVQVPILGIQVQLP